MLHQVGAVAVEVRRPAELEDLDGLVIPGGESTTIGRLAGLYGLLEPLRSTLGEGLPCFGTCAGAILLGCEALFADGTPSPQPLLEAMDTTTRRNAFGRQVASFEATIDVDGVGAMHAVFIRAPWFERCGPAVQVLANVGTVHGPKAVVVRQGSLIASAFHPELTDDPRLHRLFVESITA